MKGCIIFTESFFYHFFQQGTAWYFWSHFIFFLRVSYFRGLGKWRSWGCVFQKSTCRTQHADNMWNVWPDINQLKRQLFSIPLEIKCQLNRSYSDKWHTQSSSRQHSNKLILSEKLIELPPADTHLLLLSLFQVISTFSVADIHLYNNNKKMFLNRHLLVLAAMQIGAYKILNDPTKESGAPFFHFCLVIAEHRDTRGNKKSSIFQTDKGQNLYISWPQQNWGKKGYRKELVISKNNENIHCQVPHGMTF